jgi:UDP-N-acetylglucosamine enolpyruvyl transferase
MRRAGLTVAFAFATFAAALEDTPAVTNVNLEGEAADLAKALQNILIQTEGTEPATIKIGGEDNPLAFSISNQAGPEAVV